MERHPIVTSYPLTAMQQGMLFHHLTTPGSGVDIEQIVCELSESLDVVAFEQAWARVASLHPTLRAALRWEGIDEPAQDVHGEVQIPFDMHDWRSRDAAEQARALDAWLELDRTRGFDLERPPLTRVAILRRGEASWTCVWTLHHLLMDGRSFRIVLADVFACYEALRRGETWTPTQPRTFREHVEWLRGRDRSGDEAFWRDRLRGFSLPTPFPVQRTVNREAARDAGRGREDLRLDAATTDRLRELSRVHGFGLDTLVMGAWALLIGRMSGLSDVVFGVTRAGRRSAGPGADAVVGLLINTLPVRVSLDPEASLIPWLQKLEASERALGEREHASLLDVQRWSEVPTGTPLFESLVLYDHRSLGSALCARGGGFEQREFRLVERTPYPVTLYAYGERELGFELCHERERLDSRAARRLLDRLVTLLASVAADPECRLADLPLLSDAERRLLLVDWNDTATRAPAETCVHHAIEAQATLTPDAIALSSGSIELRHRELDARANQLAHRLRRLGVTADVRVGVATDRSPDMLVAVLGVLKAGGAYVPLDPAYPRERLALMIEDCGLAVLVTQEPVLAQLPEIRVPVICLDRDEAELGREASEAPAVEVHPEHLAYVIYTSGSTGRPKGVMVEHRQVANFFAAMDEELGRGPGVWLAVTSLSFDISVLELLWTLSRGFQVVLYAGDEAENPIPATTRPDLPMQFSLFYFASHEGGGQARDKYRLILESAKFADRRGFVAVWTPERHFHAFGGLSPNPSVTAAALAIATERVRIRSGSVVLPLHHPARVAEEWALVDNLSDGRVDLGVAQGWFPNDFVLAPDRYEDRRKLFFESLETVRKLWRGESLALPNPMGDVVEVRTTPRPLQAELPIWITAAKNPDTFRKAGEMGANVLTHLLGQSVEEVAEKIAEYRNTWREAGHSGAGTVTLMLHTFVGECDDEVHDLVRTPMKNYLGSSVDLVKDYVSSLPIFRDDPDVDPKDLSPDDVDTVLEYSFERYFRTSGLFGTPATCLGLVDRLKEIGVDELACLIDFGVDSDCVMRSLERLDQVRRLSNSSPVAAEENLSFADTVRSRGVTHLQCTPSMASMLLADEDSRSALGSLRTLLLGGEALPAALARKIRESTQAELFNMYGPTETTVWSSVHRVEEVGDSIPIGHPIANTELYVLDARRALVPIGGIGELYIGGRGVVRGYLGRPDLTAERFVPHPWRAGERLYRTGDLARHREDGCVEFLGRADQQVKLRGHRIELGEIESLLCEHPAIHEAAVVMRELSPDDQRIVAYVVPQPGLSVDRGDVLSYLRRQLPDFMIPAQVTELAQLPRTPNSKLDRAALPVDAPALPIAAAAPVAASDVEKRIAEIWGEVLGVAQVGFDANFFDLGGHSLLAVRVQGRLEASFGRRVPIVDLFRFPTVRSFAAHLSGAADTGASGGSERADARKRALAARRQRVGSQARS